MLVRRLALSLVLGAAAAGLTVGVSAAGGFKIPGSIGPIPPIVNASLPVICQIHVESDHVEYTCTATEPNPNPPKDAKTLKLSEPKASCKLTAYPDGSVVFSCRVKALQA